LYTRSGDDDIYVYIYAGTKLVFRSTKHGGDKKYKSLYIMDAEVGEDAGEAERLTEGDWTDTHCQWSPNKDWIVFSSNRDRPADAPERDHGLDPGYFAVYLMNASDRSVVRVLRSGYDLSGHVNHPVFSPDGRSIAVTADLAAVSADPISLPIFFNSVRPYGDIFTVDIDPDDMEKNQDVENFARVTHSKYENSTPAWTVFSTDDPHAQWNLLVMEDNYTPSCPYAHHDGGESWHMTGQICTPKRVC
jgi:Tol biopolymer transport system component